MLDGCLSCSEIGSLIGDAVSDPLSPPRPGLFSPTHLLFLLPMSAPVSGTATPREDILRNLERHDAVAGHAGVMRSGSLIIKPCTQDEIEFYALVNQAQPVFAQWMPTYMGQLTLNKPGHAEESILESERFEQAVVLENLEWGFRRPSVLDIKLGRVLTDEYVSEEKRIRLENVSRSTTSWEHHLRLTGMRVSPFSKVFVNVGMGSRGWRTYYLSKGLWKSVDNDNPSRGLSKISRLIDKSNPQTPYRTTLHCRRRSNSRNALTT